jgi:hypothetical protein
VKNSFGFSILLFTAFNVIGKSYRQVVNQVNNSQLLLKLEILDKFRLSSNCKIQHKENLLHYLVHTSSGEMGVLMTFLNHRALTKQCSQLTCIVIFSSTVHKLWHFAAAVLNNVVITNTKNNDLSK